MFRRFVIAAALATLSVLSPSALLGQQGAAPSPAPGATHKPMKLPPPVNLKVLPKDTSPDQLMEIMNGYGHALGVGCTFCHSRNSATMQPDFAADDKPEKNTARTMISMTNEINAKYLSQIHDPDATEADKTVTCGTCHKGHSMPIPFTGHAGAEHPGMGHPDAAPKQ
jgi:hypothetical protein